MFTPSAALYDAIYGAFKDYQSEAARVATLLQQRSPAASSVLDVGCGTGEHARHLRRSHGLRVDGLDLDEEMLVIARKKVPEARFCRGDMAAFRLDTRFDVVLCLFSSIGYLLTSERVVAALGCFRDHLAPGGLVVVEPWFAPGVLRLGPGEVREAQTSEGRVVRSSHVEVEGRISRVTFDYRVESGGETREFRELHELGLFTEAEMLAAFRDAGLTAEVDPVGLTGRGLFIAQAANE
jgi:SAM-dependent methyltransferase